MDAMLHSSDDVAQSPSKLDSVSMDRIRHALEALCGDPLFVRSPVSARLLRYLIEEDLAGRSADLKESTIGNGLYGRIPTYDTKEDAVVRVNANRLRLRLEEYYRTHLKLDVRIVLQKGSYVPSYKFALDAQANPPLAGAPSALSPTSVAGRSNRTLWLGSLVVASCCLIMLLLASLVAGRRRVNLKPEESWSARPLTRLAGSQNFASFSPDGASIVFAWLQADGTKIYEKSLTSAIPKLLVAGTGNYNRPAWSPDGKRLAYVEILPGGGVQVWILGVGTRTAEKIADLQEPQTWLCLTPRLSWTPDGRFILTTASSSGSQACELVEIDVKGRTVRPLIPPTAGILGDVEPAVSPSGESVAFIRTFSFMRSDVFLVPIHGGKPRRITNDQHDLLGFAWHPSGAMLYTASRRGDGILRLWQVQLDGAARQVTDGSATAAFPAISNDGRKIAFTDYRNVIDLFVWKNGKARRVVSDNSENSDAQLSPDGKHIIYSSDRSGPIELWVSNSDGTNPRRIAGTAIVSGHYASWSANGKRIAFECRNKGMSGICVVDANGGPILHVTDGRANRLLPSWARDGKSIYYTSKESGAYQIYRQPLNGLPASQVTRRGGIRAVESSDGLSVFVHRGPLRGGIISIPVAGSAAEQERAELSPLLDEPASGDWSDWTVSRNVLFYVARAAGKADQLYRFDLAKRQRAPLFSLKSLPVQSGRVLSTSQDGTVLTFEESAYSAKLDLLQR